MTEVLAGAMAWLAGIVLGVFFFGGLYWTLQHALRSAQPALWMLGSLLLRVGLSVAGFYLVASGGQWPRLLLCLLGFVMARGVLIRLLKPAEDLAMRLESGGPRAPES
ncbi:MAG: ATP synthase subunit I [Pseudomonadales bacterium]|nr:ATP synthase subunit I [Pseudomonadales bacterium]